jgi:hypothetical protein
MILCCVGSVAFLGLSGPPYITYLRDGYRAKALERDAQTTSLTATHNAKEETKDQDESGSGTGTGQTPPYTEQSVKQWFEAQQDVGDRMSGQGIYDPRNGYPSPFRSQ